MVSDKRKFMCSRKINLIEVEGLIYRRVYNILEFLCICY